jgi:hypothetical protein
MSVIPNRLIVMEKTPPSAGLFRGRLALRQ